MPDPNAAVDPKNVPNALTAGWQPTPDPDDDPASAVAQTLTRQTGPTPGPNHPDRRTLSDATERMGPEDPSTPKLPQIPGFRVERVIGRGGMGVVYRAVHRELNKVVALKVIYPRGRDEYFVRGRFEREAQALACIEHPNIVPVYHAGDWHGFPYLTMKFVPGGALSQHLDRFRGRPEPCARLVAKVARAVQALHDAKVIHRDLKPLNILLGENDEPLVADFGLAKWLDETAPEYSIDGVPVGTRQYMAPEQTLGNAAGYSEGCDVWAIGVTLYEVLAGHRPFNDDGHTDLAEQIRAADPPPLPEIPAELVAVVHKCLAKNPTDRYPSAATVADDLEAWLAGRPVTAPPPRPRRSRTWPVAVGVSAVLAVVLLPAAIMPRQGDKGRETPPTRRSIADRLRDRGAVYLTDANGVPKVPALPAAKPGFELTHGMDTESGFYYFETTKHGVVHFATEPLPLPVLVEAEIAVPYKPGGMGATGLLVAGRTWIGGPSVHHSAVRCEITSGWRSEDRRKTLIASVRLYRWADDGTPLGAAGSIRPEAFDWGIDPHPDARPRFVPVSVVIRADEVVATIEGHQFPPVMAANVLKSLNEDDPQGTPKLGAFRVTPPVFGGNVGISVNSTRLTVKNLRLTKLDP